MNKIFLAVIIILLVLSCGTPEIGFDSVKTLDQWYEETAAMEGFPFWSKIAYPLPPTDGITVSRLTMEDGTDIDFYFPPGHETLKNLPLIIFPRSFKKTEEFNRLGRGVLTVEYEIGWGHLLAAEGYEVVKYETDSPTKKLAEVINFIEENKKALRVSTEKIGLWTISDNPSVVLQFLGSKNEINEKIGCSAFFNPILKVSAAYSFTDMQHVPYFIAIGSADDISINKTALKFVEKCKDEGLEYEFHEHSTGGHDFTAAAEDTETEKIISACIDFFDKNLK